MNDTKRHDIAFLVLTVLAVYYPAISNTINSVDDPHIIRVYAEDGLRTLPTILIPSDQFYFRPFIELTYYLDNLLWGLDPQIMHLENIILHLANVVMLYLVASRVSQLAGNLPYLPLTSAMLYAVHPVNTEAVSWIAGRTDPLACFFILLSFFYLLNFMQHGLLQHVAISCVVMFFAILTKETAVMLLPASAVLIWGVMLPAEAGNQTYSNRGRKWVVAVYLVLFVALAGYAAVRLQLKPAGSANAFSVLFQESSLDLNRVIVDSLVTTGFYLKKFFLPLPLNFAIVEMSPLYVVPGAAALLVLWYFFKYRTILVYCMVAGLIFLIPSLVVRLAGLNWTPVAERYLYIPSAFLTIAVCGSVISWAIKNGWERLTASLCIGLLILFAGTTFHRNIIWRDNLSLFRDAVAKSPEFADIHNELGVALVKNGDCMSARPHFEFAVWRSSRPVIRDLAELNLLNCDMAEKTLAEKRVIMRSYIASRESVQPDLLRLLRSITHELFKAESEPNTRTALVREMVSLNDKLFEMVRDPHCLYSNGQFMLVLGDRSTARVYFQKTIATASVDAFYYEPAKKLIRQLE